MKKRVVIITDCVDVALLEIRGAIHSNSSNDEYIIEPVVEVDNYNLTHTSFLIRLVAEMYPPDTIICVIVNPKMLRTERIIGRTTKNNIFFEGTNTGVFGWLIEDFGCEEVVEIYDEGFVPFGGKYVHAPTVGKLISGEKIKNLGNEFNVKSIRDLPRQKGTILHIDNFGNIKFMGDLSGARNGDKYTLEYNNRKIPMVYWERMMERNDGEWVIYPGSSFGLPEVGIVRGSASSTLDVQPGDVINYYRSEE